MLDVDVYDDDLITLEIVSSDFQENEIWVEARAKAFQSAPLYMLGLYLLS